jgi:uncharacterized membrane protein YphA (DoxX/SURF4 family)
MKYLAQFSRFFVGAVFTFSGFIKLQDPAGTKIKMQEYFHVFAEDLPSLADVFDWFGEHAIYVSVFMCALELVLGVALLLSYKPKATAWILLAVVIYFGFLTFYSAYFNKVTDCGCFGDFMHLEPWTSFWKDMVLLVFILIILWQIKLFKSTKTGQIMLFTTMAAVLLGIYTNYMQPLFDFRAYAIGKNIPKQMKPSEPLRFSYTMVKNREEKIFDKYPTDTTWKYKAMTVINEEAKPKITDYAIWNDAGDFTQESFNGEKVYFIVQNTKHYFEKGMPDLKALADTLVQNGNTVALLTSAGGADIEAFKNKYGFNIPYYFGDEKVLKTIGRVNPTIWIMNNGIAKGKWSGYKLPKAKVIEEALKVELIK